MPPIASVNSARIHLIHSSFAFYPFTLSLPAATKPPGSKHVWLTLDRSLRLDSTRPLPCSRRRSEPVVLIGLDQVCVCSVVSPWFHPGLPIHCTGPPDPDLLCWVNSWWITGKGMGKEKDTTTTQQVYSFFFTPWISQSIHLTIKKLNGNVNPNHLNRSTDNGLD